MNSQSTNKNKKSSLLNEIAVSSFFLITILLSNVSHANSSGRQEMMCSVGGLVLDILLGTNEQQTTKEVSK
ncbi:hypothetical protein [Pseudomonas sp. MF4836]|uniref:hypothetical protein n=1 Tax=Pseudomonas sp. MF4836 TaxID=1960827 RepID=UPI0012907B53|nr:hypothetical protein [Pseudomonas sp. MF4836]